MSHEGADDGGLVAIFSRPLAPCVTVVVVVVVVVWLRLMQ